MEGQDRPFWQTRPCPSWCRVEHLSIDSAEDRMCAGETRAVQLSQEEARYVEQGRDAYGVPVSLEVTARHRYRETDPLVMLWAFHHQGEPARDYSLTVDEAEAVAHALLDAVKEARS